jgi:hypothetical protein
MIIGTAGVFDIRVKSGVLSGIPPHTGRKIRLFAGLAARSDRPPFRRSRAGDIGIYIFREMLPARR